MGDELQCNNYLQNGMITNFFSPLVMFGSWFDHVKSWLNAEDKERILYISYEELKTVRGNINLQNRQAISASRVNTVSTVRVNAGL